MLSFLQMISYIFTKFQEVLYPTINISIISRLIFCYFMDWWIISSWLFFEIIDKIFYIFMQCFYRICSQFSSSVYLQIITFNISWLDKSFITQINCNFIGILFQIYIQWIFNLQKMLAYLWLFIIVISWFNGAFIVDNIC